MELYQGLLDHLQNQAQEQQLNAGRVVILPSSFKGSPRAMQQNYQDSMAIVGKYGKPDLFLTYTCNPKSKEITENLKDGERPENRPDVTARVFQMHLRELLRDIKQRHVLGVPAAHIHVIEFQKRGLPHCHMLIILREEDKLRDKDDIDKVICAEIPDPAEDPQLYNIIKSSMIHGPCGILNPNSVCMTDGACSKQYPKEFQEETDANHAGYPKYRRRDNGRTVRVGKLDVDNRWVVPYNKWLSKKYGAHINVEACMSVKSVKYLFKYVYKGHDCANIEIREELVHDEITTYMDARSVSPPEAFWRLSEYKMHEQSHSITRLPVHLPLHQPVYFRPGQEDEALQRTAEKDTQLMAWFKLNTDEEDARAYMYTEIPIHYVFKQTQRKWTKRKRNGANILPRMYSVSPSAGERFFLRLLLLHVPGALSFEHLRTVNHEVFPTFKEACLAKGLLTDDTEWDNAMAEGVSFQMPYQLRVLFATICALCEPTSPVELWQRYQESMTEDYNRNHSQEVALNLALFDIQNVLRQHGKSCTDIGLPQPVVTGHEELGYNNDVEAEFARTNMQLLNQEQQQITDTIIECVNEVVAGQLPRCRTFYLDGPGGSGKTMVYNTLISYMRGKGLKVASAAWTGIAATLLRGGQTMHSLFKLPVPVLDTSSCNIAPNSNQAQFLRSLSLIVVDEASMVPTLALHAIDRLLQDITGDKVPFGGKILLFGGDFRQVLPVVPRSPPVVIIGTCLKRSPLWCEVKQFKLTQNMRARHGEEEFVEWLLKLGDGKLKSNQTNASESTIDIPERCVVDGSLTTTIFDHLDEEHVKQRVILCPKNEDALAINEEVLRLLPSETKEYLSADSISCDDEEEQVNYPVEFLHGLTPSGMPPHRLNLKINAIIMLLRSLNLRQGLCNGTRLIVRRLYPNTIDAEVLTGTYQGTRAIIPRIKLAPSDANLPFVLQRWQFPVRLSYSMTINKAQGQTFEKVGIYLQKPVFAHGQLYVAFSRARSFDDIKVKIITNTQQGKKDGISYTQNIVYPEVLQ